MKKRREAAREEMLSLLREGVGRKDAASSEISHDDDDNDQDAVRVGSRCGGTLCGCGQHRSPDHHLPRPLLPARVRLRTGELPARGVALVQGQAQSDHSRRRRHRGDLRPGGSPLARGSSRVRADRGLQLPGPRERQPGQGHPPRAGRRRGRVATVHRQHHAGVRLRLRAHQRRVHDRDARHGAVRRVGELVLHHDRQPWPQHQPAQRPAPHQPDRRSDGRGDLREGRRHGRQLRRRAGDTARATRVQDVHHRRARRRAPGMDLRAVGPRGRAARE